MALALDRRDVETNVNLTVGSEVDVRFLVNREDSDTATLVIGDSIAEIILAPATLATLHERAGVALDELRGGERGPE